MLSYHLCCWRYLTEWPGRKNLDPTAPLSKESCRNGSVSGKNELCWRDHPALFSSNTLTLPKALSLLLEAMIGSFPSFPSMGGDTPMRPILCDLLHGWQANCTINERRGGWDGRITNRNPSRWSVHRDVTTQHMIVKNTWLVDTAHCQPVRPMVHLNNVLVQLLPL